MQKCRQLIHRNSPEISILVTLLAFWIISTAAIAAEDFTVKGTLISNGNTVELPYVYVWAEKEGFYDSADPAWTILFVERALTPREIGDHIWDAAWIRIGVTETKEFTEQPEVQIYSQSIKLTADSGGNLTGGEYPQHKLEGVGSNRISGRIWQPEFQQVFDDSFQYDFSFSASISDPDAPIGELLPTDGGIPGQAYLQWVKAIHSGEVENLKRIVPPEMADQLGAGTAEEAQEELKFMQSVTPTDVKIISGSTDGEIAIIKIDGLMDGERIPAEVTMTRFGEFWIPTNFSF